MSNIANLPKLYYCGKKTGFGTCSNLAAFKVNLVKRKDKQNSSAKIKQDYRCKEHKTTKTANLLVIDSIIFNQDDNLTEVNKFLHTLINKNIVSKVHTAKMLRVKYVKFDKAGVMCFQEHPKQWKFVYYDQITKIL